MIMEQSSQNTGEVNSHNTSTTTPTERISPPKMGRVGCHDPYSPRVLRSKEASTVTMSWDPEDARKATSAELTQHHRAPWTPALPPFLHAQRSPNNSTSYNPHSNNSSYSQSYPHYHHPGNSLQSYQPMMVPAAQATSQTSHPPPYISFPTAPLSPGNVHHNALSEVCTFVSIPAGRREVVVAEDTNGLTELLMRNAAPPRPLFIGQCRFELSAGELEWLLERLLGVRALKIEPRGPGCFVVVLRDDASSTKVLQLHRCILFDHDGVWWAPTPAAQQQLEVYVREFLSGQYSRRSRLPRDTMIVERQRGSLNPLRTLVAASHQSAAASIHPHQPGSVLGGSDSAFDTPTHYIAPSSAAGSTSSLGTPAAEYPAPHQHHQRHHASQQPYNVSSTCSIGSSPSNAGSLHDSFHYE